VLHGRRGAAQTLQPIRSIGDDVATYTVSAFKTRVAAIPVAANTWRMEVPDDLLIPVHDTRSFSPDGTLQIHIRGYLNLATGDWTPV
jgi:hypothetical protein